MRPYSIFNIKPASWSRLYLIAAVLACLLLIPGSSIAKEQSAKTGPKYVILMISDGWGINHIEATSKYTGLRPVYDSWDEYWVSTYPAGGGYDPALAWSGFDYVRKGATDSAASATAMYTGTKTKHSYLSVSPDGKRLATIAERARALNMAVGAVTTVQISHATPGAWYAHNVYRFNSYAVAEEGLFGDPQATYREWDWKEKAEHVCQTAFHWIPRSSKVCEDLYAGDRGKSEPVDVLIGSGGTGYAGESYLNDHIYKRLRSESSKPGKHTLIEAADGLDNSERLKEAALNDNVNKLVGIFDFGYRLADGSGQDPHDPTLAQMAEAAITVLSRNPNGFVLLIEGGAVDFAGHDNNMDHMIGEEIDFDMAVRAVADWVKDPDNGSNWDNTTVIVTGDHESGYLTGGPGVFPDRPLGEVSDRTISLEKEVGDSRCRASWEDNNSDGDIDKGETVYWAWNACRESAHTNMLVPLYVKGLDAGLFETFEKHKDPVRGPYLDNTSVFRVMESAISRGAADEDIDVNMTGITGGIN